MDLKTVWADFNCGQSSDGLMRLNTTGSLLSLKESEVESGDEVRLTDGEVTVVAVIVVRDGVPHARFNWNDIRDVDA